MLNADRQRELSVRAADVYCRYLANQHYENFSVAGAFLPAELRLHLARIYAFCRTTDDLGDESHRSALGGSYGGKPNAEARLMRWREMVDDLFDGDFRPIHPVLLSLSGTVERFALPRQPFVDLIAANLQDQRVATYKTWDDLRAYCMLSAAPVGRMVLEVFEVHDVDVSLSDDVCIGLQLANFAQDVSVDRTKGRTYLPQSELRDGVEAAVRRMCERSEQLLVSGEQLERNVPGRLRVQLALYRLGGMAILSAIRQAGYRTDQIRPTVSPATKLRLLPRVILQSTRGNRYGEKLRTPAT